MTDIVKVGHCCVKTALFYTKFLISVLRTKLTFNVTIKEQKKKIVDK